MTPTLWWFPAIFLALHFYIVHHLWLDHNNEVIKWKVPVIKLAVHCKVTIYGLLSITKELWSDLTKAGFHIHQQDTLSIPWWLSTLRQVFVLSDPACSCLWSWCLKCLFFRSYDLHIPDLRKTQVPSIIRKYWFNY